MRQRTERIRAIPWARSLDPLSRGQAQKKHPIDDSEALEGEYLPSRPGTFAWAMSCDPRGYQALVECFVVVDNARTLTPQSRLAARQAHSETAFVANLNHIILPSCL